jgi:hypothetical protein
MTQYFLVRHHGSLHVHINVFLVRRKWEAVDSCCAVDVTRLTDGRTRVVLYIDCVGYSPATELVIRCLL